MAIIGWTNWTTLKSELNKFNMRCVARNIEIELLGENHYYDRTTSVAQTEEEILSKNVAILASRFMSQLGLTLSRWPHDAEAFLGIYSELAINADQIIQKKLSPSLPSGNSYNLAQCNCRVLTKTIFQATQISTLILKGNGLFYIPPQIKNLINLTKIDLQDNRISQLPDSFKDLTKLTHINISGNLFESFPMCLDGLDDLQEIDLSANKIEELPKKIFGHWSKLVTFLGNENPIKQIPSTIFFLAELKTLTLANTCITHIDKLQGNNTVYDTFQMPSLTQLNISNNKLNRWPNFGEFPHLRLLILQNVGIGGISADALKSFPLAKVDLRRNPIGYIDNEITSFIEYLSNDQPIPDHSQNGTVFLTPPT